jgi:DNA-binding FadR family transcriptional regulator
MPSDGQLKVQSSAIGHAADEPAKRAEQIASAIEQKILEGQYDLDAKLGNEAALAKAYSVSRWTMREAIAILEHAGTVISKRGAGGGLFVAAPANELIRHSICAYLELSLTSYDAIAETRVALAEASIETALVNMDNSARVELASLLLEADAPRPKAVEAMAEARNKFRAYTGKPLLALFHSALSDVGLHSCWMSSLDDQAFFELIDQLSSTTYRFTLAMLANQAETARDAERQTVRIMAKLHRSSSISGDHQSAPNALERAFSIHPSAHSGKKVERIAWAIRRYIFDQHLPAGTVIGSEESLMRDYGAGRPVLREAIRILERMGAVEMRRGGISGLTVGKPDPSHVIQLAQNYFKRSQPSEDDRLETIKLLQKLPAGNPVAALMIAILTH